MFYPVDSLKRGGRFYLCWVADSWPLRFATITHRQLWSQDIRQICDDLMEVVKNESGRPVNRFSLRLSSQLLRGLVRLYQKKVTVFVGDLCMINARVMKFTNKKCAFEETTHDVVEQFTQLPLILIEEQEDEERVAERIENSGNVVANIQDITLQEPTIPENRLLLDDGFGELPGERSAEVMLGGEHMSVLSIPEVSARSEQERSRLARSFAHEQMEGIDEHELTVFGKSMGDITIPATDIEKDIGKDIPEFPDIPIPDLLAPEPVNQTLEAEMVKDAHVIQNPIEPDEIVLENALAHLKNEYVIQFYTKRELVEEPQIKRRRLKNKLIIDKVTKTSSDIMVSRIYCVNLEQRCEDSTDDVIKIIVPAAVYFNRPAHAGCRARSNLGYTCTGLFTRNLGIIEKRPFADRDMQEALTARLKRNLTPVLEHIEEEPPVPDQPRPWERQEMATLEVARDNIQEPSAMEFAELPTQKIMTSSALKRTSDLDVTPKRLRHSGYVSFRQSHRLIDDILAIEGNKENVPVSENIPVLEDVPVDDRRRAERLTALLFAEGLADVVEASDGAARAPAAGAPAAGAPGPLAGSDGSCTPLGSLDRTRVSLGDSEATTDSRRFIRDEWGTQGTMHKIYSCVRRGIQPIDVPCLVGGGPVLAGHSRTIAARCFTSILKLKQHEFINVVKDSENYEIINISLGRKIVLH